MQKAYFRHKVVLRALRGGMKLDLDGSGSGLSVRVHILALRGSVRRVIPEVRNALFSPGFLVQLRVSHFKVLLMKL